MLKIKNLIRNYKSILASAMALILFLSTFGFIFMGNSKVVHAATTGTGKTVYVDATNFYDMFGEEVQYTGKFLQFCTKDSLGSKNSTRFRTLGFKVSIQATVKNSNGSYTSQTFSVSFRNDDVKIIGVDGKRTETVGNYEYNLYSMNYQEIAYAFLNKYPDVKNAAGNSLFQIMTGNSVYITIDSYITIVDPDGTNKGVPKGSLSINTTTGEPNNMNYIYITETSMENAWKSYTGANKEFKQHYNIGRDIWDPIKTTYNYYTINVNGSLDGVSKTSTENFLTFDVYINDVLVKTGVRDYSATILEKTSYRIDNIKADTGYTYQSGSSSNLSKSSVTSDFTTVLAAKTNTYTVTFNGNGGSTPSPSSKVYTQGSTYGTFPTTSRSHYIFNGWYTASSGGTKKETSNTVTSSHTLYAQWIKDNHTLTINKDGNVSSVTGAGTYTCGTAVKITATAKTGYSISSIKDSNGTSYSNGASITLDGNKTISVSSSPNAYTVTFNANGGTLTDSGSKSSTTRTMTYSLGNYNNVSGFAPIRAGYTFGGWFTTSASTGGTQVYYSNGACANGSGYWNGSAWIYTGNVTLYARWIPNTYTISYNGNGHTRGSMSSSSHTYDAAKTLTTNRFTKTGYTFQGWATSAAGSVVYGNGQSVKNLTTVNGQTITLYAVWKDVTAPAVTITTNPSSWINSAVTITATASDTGSGLKTNSLVIKNGAGAIVAQGTSTITYVDTTSGQETYTAEAYDNSGNKGSSSKVSYIDYVPPTISGLKDVYEWTNLTQNLEANVSDAGGSGLKKYELKNADGNIIMNGSLSSNSAIISLTFETEQNTHYTLIVYDNAGNDSSFVFVMEIDKTPPIIILPDISPDNPDDLGPDDSDDNDNNNDNDDNNDNGNNDNDEDNDDEQLPTDLSKAKEFGWFKEDTLLSFIVKDNGAFNSGISSITLTDLDTSENLSSGLQITQKSDYEWEISYLFTTERKENYRLTVVDNAGSVLNAYIIVKIDKTAPVSIIEASLNGETDFSVAGWTPLLSTFDKAVYGKGYDDMLTIISQGSNDPTDVSGLKKFNIYIAEDCDINGILTSEYYHMYDFDATKTAEEESGDFTAEFKQVFDNIYSIDEVKNLSAARIIAIAEDFAGNITIAKTESYMNFFINGYVERAYASTSSEIVKENQFHAGEKGVINIETIGYVDNVEVVFDARLERWLAWQKLNMNSNVAAELIDMELSSKFAVNPKQYERLKFIKRSYPKTTINVYSDTSFDALLGYDFHVPFYADTDTYTIKLIAYKNGYTTECNLDITVGSSIIKFFRTRIRIPSVLIDIDKEINNK